MAIKGLSKPICGEYSDKGNGVVEYTNPYSADSAVEYAVEVESGEENDLFADNRVKESAGGVFVSGTLTLQTADITPELSMKILGLKETSRTVNGKEVTEVVYDDEQEAPDLGFGIIEEHHIDGVTKYLPIILPKVRFNVPGNAATTRAGEIEWQTKEISAKIMRSDQEDDNYKHPWQITPKEMFHTEKEALAYNRAVLGETTVSIATKQ